jgi:hypothetical protein
MASYRELMKELYRQALEMAEAYENSGIDISSYDISPPKHYSESRKRNYDRYKKKLEQAHQEFYESMVKPVYDRMKEEEESKYSNADYDDYADQSNDDPEYIPKDEYVWDNYMTHLEYYKFAPNVKEAIDLIYSNKEHYMPLIIEGDRYGELPDIHYVGSYEYAQDIGAQVIEYLSTIDNTVHGFIQDEGYATGDYY